MRRVIISAADFLAIELPHATVIKLTPSFVESAGVPDLRRLSQVATFYRLTLETPKDFELVEEAFLVWYTINEQAESAWNKEGCNSYTVARYVDDMIRNRSVLESNKEHGERIKEIEALTESLKRGLMDDVVIVSALDTGLGRRLIVDGCKRSVSLAMLARQNEEGFPRLLRSRFAVTIVEVESALAHCLYPADFLAVSASSDNAPRSLSAE